MLSLIALLSVAVPAQANEIPCANMAKYAAIRAYKAEVGEVQGSDGMQYSAFATSVNNGRITYLVSISENNEDGESWEFGYYVDLRWREKASPQCKIISVTKAVAR
jgi:hypothetical protein